MNINSKILCDKLQPIICIGRYSSCVNYLLSSGGGNFLASKNLWIDFRVIPLFNFYNARNIIKTEFYFIECNSTKEITMICESKELFNLKSYNFTSLVINIPPYLSKRHEISNILNQLALSLTVIILTSDLNFPANESQIIRVDEEWK